MAHELITKPSNIKVEVIMPLCVGMYAVKADNSAKAITAIAAGRRTLPSAMNSCFNNLATI